MVYREEFEAWALKNCYILRLDENGDYEKDVTFSAYEAWQAAKAQAVPQWIPVNDPPKEIGRYWCYVEEQNDLGVSHYQWNCSWNGDEWSGECLTGVVTHWMPLLSAPEQQK